MRDLNKFKGCLIGGAVGDALGYAVEFLPASEIFKKYGENGITEYELHNGVAEISDDTQMTLFTATGLLVGTTRGMTRGIMGGYAGSIITAAAAPQVQLPEIFLLCDKQNTKKLSQVTNK